MQQYNESETRSKLIDPLLFSHGWTEDNIIREHIVAGQKWNNSKSLYADYVLTYKGVSLAVIEAKANYKSPTEGVTQAKTYGNRLNIRYVFATNGLEIYMIDLKTKEAGMIAHYPSPEELWKMTFAEENEWRDRFYACPWGRIANEHFPRYYQKNAANAVLSAIAQNKNRLLLTLATGTGKTGIAFSIAWKLFETRWTLDKDQKRRPRILFLADRTNLADQAKKDFSSFKEEQISRISPQTLSKNPDKAINANIFFSIFQTFSINQKGQMIDEDEDNTDTNAQAFFGTLPQDFFDMIIIDECHRGGARDESSWRAILEYFSPAVQLGLTATPKRRDNVDTYDYFGEPLYTYSLKDGITDGHLTPFRVHQVQTSLDEYQYHPEDTVLSGEINKKNIYKDKDWNATIHSEDRERLFVQKIIECLPPYEKTIIFCKSQAHALLIRELINEELKPEQDSYCVRVTSNEPLGNTYLSQFQDNEKHVPAILTTSQKLTTGVNAKNVRHIILLRLVNNMIEFKQIIGRGTRLFDGKDYFTIHDFYKNYHHFSDPEWDGEPLEEIIEDKNTQDIKNTEKEITSPKDIKEIKEKLRIKLSNNTIQEFQIMESTKFYSPSGEIISAETFIKSLYEIIPRFFDNEKELKHIWADSLTRKGLLDRLAEEGVSLESLITIQKVISSEETDIFDVLEYFAYNKNPLPKSKRAELVRQNLYNKLTDKQQEFIEFLLDSYLEKGHEALTSQNMSQLLKIKYNSLQDGLLQIGTPSQELSILLNKVQNEIYEHEI